MKSFGELIRSLRQKEGYTLRKVATYLDMDQAVLSKIERGQRKMSRTQVIRLAEFFNYNEKEMLVSYLSDKIMYELAEEDCADEVLKIAEHKINYQRLMAMDRTMIKEQIGSVLMKFAKVNRAWIFGSFSRESDKTNSDIDIAIEADSDFSYFDLAEVQYRLEEKLNRAIDIGFIDSFKPYILNNIRQDLKIIYER